MSAEVSASPAAGGRVPLDKVRALQHTLYRAAKADPGRRFHALWDKVLRRDVLWRAWVAVRATTARRVSTATLAAVEEYGVDPASRRIGQRIEGGRYRPLPARRVFIPKPGTNEQRPLSIPTVRDRVVQAAVKIVLEPVFEADFLPCSFGFRPKKSAHDALQVVDDEAWRGRRWVVETDIASCFEAIPHEQLMQAVQERVVDQSVLKLLRAMLRAGVMDAGAGAASGYRNSARGRDQSDVVQRVPAPAGPAVGYPGARRAGPLCRRSVGDVRDPTASRDRAGAVAGVVGRAWLGAEGGQDPHRAACRSERRGSTSSAFTTSRCGRGLGSGERRVSFLARWPSDKAMQRARDRAAGIHAAIPALLSGRDGGAGHESVPARLGRVLPVRPLGRPARQDQNYALQRLAVFIGKRHKSRHARGYGMSVLGFRAASQYGLVTLAESSSRPGPPSPGGRNRMPAVNDVGEPCAGEPHARFDGRELETESCTEPRSEGRTLTGKPARASWPTTYSQETPPRQFPTQLLTLGVV